MGKVIHFPSDARSKLGFERVKSTYTARDIGKQFGLSERHIRRWTEQGLVQRSPSSEPEDPRYDFHALKQFRRVRELRGTRAEPEADRGGAQGAAQSLLRSGGPADPAAAEADGLRGGAPAARP